MNGKPKVFLDTSVWIAAILSDRGASFVITAAALEGAVALVSSPDVFEEATRNLRLKYPERLADFILQFSLIRPLLVQPTKPQVLLAARTVHPDDAPILAAAKAARAQFLVTLDRKHLLVSSVQSAHPTIKIITPGEFLRYLRITGYVYPPADSR